MILTELLDRTVGPTLKLIKGLGGDGLDADGALWILVHDDVALLCSGRYNRGALLMLPEARGLQLAAFWCRRDRLFVFYRRFLLDGQTSGGFPAAPGPLAADLIFSLVESVINARPSVRSNPDIPALYADTAFRGLGVPARRIAEVRQSDRSSPRERSRCAWAQQV